MSHDRLLPTRTVWSLYWQVLLWLRILWKVWSQLYSLCWKSNLQFQLWGVWKFGGIRCEWAQLYWQLRWATRQLRFSRHRNILIQRNLLWVWRRLDFHNRGWTQSYLRNTSFLVQRRQPKQMGLWNLFSTLTENARVLNAHSINLFPKYLKNL